MKFEIYDPPMCCSTGVCGPAVDPVLCKGSYPNREQLAGIAGIELRACLMTDAVPELVAIGASIAANCEPCLKHHVNQARQLGVSKEDMRQAVDTAQMVKDSPARAMLALADRLLRDTLPMAAASSCCGSEEGTASGGKCCG